MMGNGNKLSPPKDGYLQVRISEEESALIEAVATAYGMNKSQMVIAMTQYFAVNRPLITIEPAFTAETLAILPKASAPAAPESVEAALAI